MVIPSNVARSHETDLGASIAWRAVTAAPAAEEGAVMVGALTALVARIRASTWAFFLVKGFSILCVLGFLVWIGGRKNLGALERAPPATPTFADVPEAGVAIAPVVDAGAPEVVPSTVAPPAGVVHGRATADEPVYLNEANVEDLRRLPGVGAKRAEAILAHRRHVGRFTRVEDLLRVKGVGRATIKKWRPLVRFDQRAAVTDAGSS